MKKFKLESVLKLRQRERDKAAGDVQEIRHAMQLFDEQIEQVRREAGDSAVQRKLLSTGHVNVNQLIEVQRYEMQLAMQLRAMMDKREILVNEQQRREAVLLGCQQRLRAIELLKEKHFETVKAQEERALQSRLDEWSNTRGVLTEQMRGME